MTAQEAQMGVCGVCKGRVATSAAACPHCGAPVTVDRRKPLTLRQAANALGLRYQEAWKLVSQEPKRLWAYRVKGHRKWLVDRDEIERFKREECEHSVPLEGRAAMPPEERYRGL